MKFLIKTTSLLCFILFLTNTSNAQNFLEWADYSGSCAGKATLSMNQTSYNENPALHVIATVNSQPAIVNIIAPANGHTSNNQDWTYNSYSAIVGYGPGIGYGNIPNTDEVTCYYYFADGTSCKNVCTVEIDF